jgi:hypothetical protein
VQERPIEAIAPHKKKKTRLATMLCFNARHALGTPACRDPGKKASKYGSTRAIKGKVKPSTPRII